MTLRPMMRRFALLMAVAPIASCARNPVATIEPWSPAFPFPVDTLRVQQLRPGVSHYFVYSHQGPWAIHILEVNRDACWSALAVKGAPGAIGRTKTSELMAQLAKTQDVAGGVNGDFFLFTPPGVPTNAHISGGHVVTGPNDWPVIAFDSAGRPSIVRLEMRGETKFGASGVTVAAWNRRLTNGVAWFDAHWGSKTDTASRAVEVALDNSRVLAVDTVAAGVDIPAGGGVLVVSGATADSLRSALLSLRAGDGVALSASLAPAPAEAVGGRPAIVRDSMMTPDATAGAANSFARLRHPRTAVGIARGGWRLLLVTVDGRQAPYSDGMNLRELADLFLSMGARDALNLDGGGSTTMVISERTGDVRIANKPSDKEGERPVGNALAIVKGCTR